MNITTASKHPSSIPGPAYVFIAALLYSLGGVCIKVIPWNGLSINSARNLISVAVIGLYLTFIRHKVTVSRWVLLGALCVCGTNTLYALANKLTTAANTIVLQYTAPIFVILLTLIFFRKRPAKTDLWCCAVTLLGVLCFFVDSMSAGDALGNVLALLSGLTYAGVFLLNDMPDADPISSILLGNIFSVLIGFHSLTQETSFSAVTITSVMILGVFQVAVAYICLTIGLRTTPAVTASLISGVEPVLNPILVAIVCHEMIGPLSLIGAVIVIAAVLTDNLLHARRVRTAAA